MIIHRRTSAQDNYHTWGVLCGQWAPYGKNVTDEDEKTTCQKCLAQIERRNKHLALAAKKSKNGVEVMRP